MGAALARLERAPQGPGRRGVDPPTCPSCPWTRVLMEQVLVNLLDNAFKYSDPRLARSRIRGAPRTDGDGDGRGRRRGPGPAAPARRSACSRSSTAAARRTTRLRPRACRSAARSSTAHGGRIWAENRSAAGRRLPLHAPARATPPPPPVEDAVSTERPPPAKAPAELVLVVEDEPEVMRFLRATLPAARVTASSRRRPESRPWSRRPRARPDLILLDLGLPDIDGVEVARRIREWSATPIIVLSARGQETRQDRGPRRRRRRLPDQAVRRRASCWRACASRCGTRPGSAPAPASRCSRSATPRRPRAPPRRGSARGRSGSRGRSSTSWPRW